MLSAGALAAPGAKPAQNFKNPIIWEDLPDMEVIRVQDMYYMSASSFAFSPGAPVLRSCNLVDWEYIGHSVPELATFGERFSLTGQHTGSYVKGIWASSMRYRKSNGLFYWYGAIQGTEKTFIFTAKNPEDTWDYLSSIDKFYYDLGLLVDDDDSLYIAYGTKSIHVAQLSVDGRKEIKSKASDPHEIVYTSDEYLEGARMYNINGAYYIWLTRPHAGQYVLKSTAGPFGPYECRRVVGAIRSPIAGSGYPHQGAIVDTIDGEWYYMAFMDGWPGGRIPVLAPISFDHEGWPQLEADFSSEEGLWKLEYPFPAGCSEKPTRSCFREHRFENRKLDHCWEWNHSPDNLKWAVENSQLVLSSGTVTDSLHLATNTLTHRTIGPKSMATFCLQADKLQDGDRAGACMFRDRSAYIGIHKDGSSIRLAYVNNICIRPRDAQVGWINGHPVALDWLVESNGTIREETPLVASKVWLRIKADITPAFSDGYEKRVRYTTFEYSYDGETFEQFGPPFAVSNSADGFVGYRFGVFCFATQSLGGRLSVESCSIQQFVESNDL